MTTTPDPDGAPTPTTPSDTGRPGASSGPAEPSATAPRERGPRRLSELAVVGLLSAGLAAGGTAGAIHLLGDEDTATAATEDTATSTTTTQAAPASYQGTPGWSAVSEEVTPSTVSITVSGQRGQGAGSGVVWDTEGHIVTNAHVVAGGQQVEVSFSDGRTYPAEVVGADPSSDLAVLAVPDGPENLTPVQVGESSELQVGEPVMAVGNPLGLSGTVTTGIVSALDRPVTTESGGTLPGQPGSPVVTNAIQTSAPINPGNSGGALVDGAGQLIGINSSIASLSQGPGGQGGSIGIGFAIPADKVALIADQLIETGTATHAFLGVSMQDGEAEVEGATLYGAQVRQIEPDSPAAGAGLETGDVITAIDDQPVGDAVSLVGHVREHGTGDEVTLTYVRDGTQAEAPVTLATRPDGEG